MPDLVSLLEITHEFFGYAFELRVIEPADSPLTTLTLTLEMLEHDLVLLWEQLLLAGLLHESACLVSVR